jgi:uncharacterized protein (TIGR04255 family)
VSQRFPHYADVPLTRAPLGEVICQVRYAPVFRIASHPPGEFQEAILDRFPEAEVGDDSDPYFYRFATNNAESAFTLGPESFSLATNRYTVWEDFGQDLALVQSAMQKAYRIPRYRRIGLRYLNVFTPANTGGGSLAQISEVLRPELVLPLRTKPLSDASELATHLLLDEPEGKLVIRVGAKADPDEGGPILFLDLDFYVEGRLSTEGLVERCKRYHDVIYGAFRWSLNENEKVLDLFEPLKEGVRR